MRLSYLLLPEPNGSYESAEAKLSDDAGCGQRDNALRLFSKRLRDTSVAFSIQMQPGDLVIFNNRRIIERGTGDLESSSEVFMQGCYMDASEILASYEKMKKDDAIDSEN